MSSDNFVKRRKHPKYLASRERAGAKGVINPCFKPSAEASKADLAEYHAEEMGLRRAHQRARVPNVRWHRRSTSIAEENRHGGQHQHKREIARRSRA